MGRRGHVLLLAIGTWFWAGTFCLLPRSQQLIGQDAAAGRGPTTQAYGQVRLTFQGQAKAALPRCRELRVCAGRVSFRLHEDAPVEVSLGNGTFPVGAGKEYVVLLSCGDPQILTGSAQGELRFTIQTPLNALVVVEPVRGPNLLPDPSFEQGGRGWEGEARRKLWPSLDYGHEGMKGPVEPGAEAAPRHAWATCDTGTALSGRRSFRLGKSQFAGTAALTLKQPVPVRSGRVYLFGAYVRLREPAYGSAIHAQVHLEAEGRPTRTVKCDRLSPLLPNPASGWRRTWARFRVPDGYGRARVVVHVRGGSVDTWWDDLDLIGMTTYYDLTGGKDPTLGRLIEAWKPIKKKVLAWQAKIGRPLLFTEVGWPNQTTCAQYPWNYYEAPESPDPTAQANCFQAFFQTWSGAKAVGGFLVWEWRNHPGQEVGPEDTSYVPCGKPAMKVIENYYRRPGPPPASQPAATRPKDTPQAVTSPGD